MPEFNGAELDEPVADVVPTAVATADEDEEDVDETRSHEGHIVRVVGGFMCM